MVSQKFICPGRSGGAFYEIIVPANFYEIIIF
jgi:hypothetical protein